MLNVIARRRSPGQKGDDESGDQVTTAGQVASEVDQHREERGKRGAGRVDAVTALGDLQVLVAVVDQEMPGPRMGLTIDRVRARPDRLAQQPGGREDEKGEEPGARQSAAQRR
jgi:hypothetical protein